MNLFCIRWATVNITFSKTDLLVICLRLTIWACLLRAGPQSISASKQEKFKSIRAEWREVFV